MSHWQKKRIAVLYGGNSSEREVSLNSGQAVFEALKRLGYDACLVDTQHDAIGQLTALKPDVAFIVLHGQGGEDGRIQALLEALEIPYTGSDVASSAIAMDKVKCKLIWRGLGLPTADYELIASSSTFQDLSTTLGLPFFIKPACEGSSIGVNKVSCAESFSEAIADASRFKGGMLAEAFMSGREFTVPILGSDAFPSISMVPTKEFYDYESKYLRDDTSYLIPSGLTANQESRIRELAKHAFEAIGCAGWGRVDFIESAEGELNLLELNTVPGMTNHSLVPMSLASVGVEFDAVVERILNHVEAA
jgi:D-alanine-D-alanine ligase